MDGKEQKEMYATEVYNRKVLNLRNMSDESLERLRKAQQGKKQFKGNNNYQMLQNLNYMTGFQYQSIDMRNEEIDSILSDVVSQLLYLAPNFMYKNGFEKSQKITDSKSIKSLMLTKMIKDKKESKGKGILDIG